MRPLEILFVREVMRQGVIALRADASIEAVAAALRADREQRPQLLYPVVDEDRRLAGVVRHSAAQRALDEQPIGSRNAGLSDLTETDPVVAYPDEPLRVIAYRMAETGLTRFPARKSG